MSLQLTVSDRVVRITDPEEGYESVAIPRQQFLAIMDRLLDEFAGLKPLQETDLPFGPQEG